MKSKLTYIEKLSKMIIRTLAELAEMVARVEGGTETEKAGDVPGRFGSLRMFSDYSLMRRSMFSMSARKLLSTSIWSLTTLNACSTVAWSLFPT